jgi:hypothetical protein
MASIDGKNLAVLKTDPFNCLVHAMGMEKQKNGRQIAQKAYNLYFGTSESDDDLVTQYGKV